MSISGMRWGDSCSSDEDEVGVKVPTRHESSSDESDNHSLKDRKGSTPPTRFVAPSGGNTQKNHHRGSGNRGVDDRWDNRGGRSGRGGRGERQGKLSNKGAKEWSGRGGKGGKKNGKQTQFSVTIGASEWKDIAMEAKKYENSNNANKITFDGPEHGNNWMAIRQKKAEEKKLQERLKREQELKDKRKHQTEALKAAVVEHKKQETSNLNRGKSSESNEFNNPSSGKQPPSSSLNKLVESSQSSLTDLEKKFTSHSTSNPGNRPKLVLKPRTLPIRQVEENSSSINDLKKDQKQMDEEEKETINHESGEESVVTASSLLSVSSAGGRGDRKRDFRKKSGRGRGRGRGTAHNPSKLRHAKNNDSKKDRIPHRKPTTVKGDLLPNGTVRLSKVPTHAGNSKTFSNINRNHQDGDKNEKKNKGSKSNDRHVKQSKNDGNFKNGNKVDKEVHQKKDSGGKFRQITKIEIGGESTEAQYSTRKHKNFQKSSN